MRSASFLSVCRLRSVPCAGMRFRLAASRLGCAPKCVRIDVSNSLLKRNRGTMQRSIRFPEKTDASIEAAVRDRKFASPTAFIRYAVNQELGSRRDHLEGIEDRLAATIEQMRREVFRLGRAQQALFAYVDSLAKVILTCIPEPPTEAKVQAIARAKERHSRLLKSAGASMVGDSHAAMWDLAEKHDRQ